MTTHSPYWSRIIFQIILISFNYSIFGLCCINGIKYWTLAPVWLGLPFGFMVISLSYEYYLEHRLVSLKTKSSDRVSLDENVSTGRCPIK